MIRRRRPSPRALLTRRALAATETARPPARRRSRPSARPPLRPPRRPTSPSGGSLLPGEHASLRRPPRGGDARGLHRGSRRRRGSSSARPRARRNRAAGDGLAVCRCASLREGAPDLADAGERARPGRDVHPHPALLPAGCAAVPARALPPARRVDRSALDRLAPDRPARPHAPDHARRPDRGRAACVRCSRSHRTRRASASRA